MGHVLKILGIYEILHTPTSKAFLSIKHTQNSKNLSFVLTLCSNLITRLTYESFVYFGGLFKKRKLYWYAPGFVMKNHLTATYPYICTENSSTSCMCILHGFCKMLWYYCSIFCSFWISLVNCELKKRITIFFYCFKCIFKVLNFRFWQVSLSFDFLLWLIYCVVFYSNCLFQRRPKLFIWTWVKGHTLRLLYHGWRRRQGTLVLLEGSFCYWRQLPVWNTDLFLSVKH